MANHMQRQTRVVPLCVRRKGGRRSEDSVEGQARHAMNDQ